ncbi:MAG: hypothetical protein WCE49_10895 [Terrimicrobiaceae bacterium]
MAEGKVIAPSSYNRIDFGYHLGRGSPSGFPRRQLSDGFAQPRTARRARFGVDVVASLMRTLPAKGEPKELEAFLTVLITRVLLSLSIVSMCSSQAAIWR